MYWLVKFTIVNNQEFISCNHIVKLGVHYDSTTRIQSDKIDSSILGSSYNTTLSNGCVIRYISCILSVSYGLYTFRFIDGELRSIQLTRRNNIYDIDIKNKKVFIIYIDTNIPKYIVEFHTGHTVLYVLTELRCFICKQINYDSFIYRLLPCLDCR